MVDERRQDRQSNLRERIAGQLTKPPVKFIRRRKWLVIEFAGEEVCKRSDKFAKNPGAQWRGAEGTTFHAPMAVASLKSVPAFKTSRSAATGF
jgi:hypothetical protein